MGAVQVLAMNEELSMVLKHHRDLNRKVLEVQSRKQRARCHIDPLQLFLSQHAVQGAEYSEDLSMVLRPLQL